MKRFYTTAVVLACAASCASASGYKYYVIDPVGGKLLASKPADDLPLMETCVADATDKAKCIAMLREEYFKQEAELLQLRQDVKNCQKPNP